ncbi:TPA: ash family protein [Citrobacter farmeri]|uniref:host cell division inhibitor Icd-like protein n=1 Tax=Citrobacter farmeri TaxID=67824 RepID=UPI00228913EE|nr:host cell division inhibitor Icd-like protein [Citrobacter farmeri]MEC3930850.1 host cell division inhibitor Icd-like protein [Citrobacter farmeri]HCW7016939.1 ash family protein [Citrobacter farmeri]
MRIPVLQKAPFSGLRPLCVSWYSFPAVAKSAAGRRNPCYSMATPDAPCVFFYVVAQVYPFFRLWFFCRGLFQIMVIRAGQPSGWPVSIEAGIPTPVRVTTHECRNSGGGNNRYSMEAAIMATTLTLSHPQFVFVFAAVRRADRKRRVCMLRTVAGDERAARLSLVRDYILTFAGRLPVTEVRA